ILNREPPRPSALRPGLDAALEALCLRAMARRPEDRFPDAAAFADALRGWLRSADATVAVGPAAPAPVAASPAPAAPSATLPAPTPRPPSRRRLALAAAALAAVVVAAVVFWPRRGPPPQPAAAKELPEAERAWRADAERGSAIAQSNLAFAYFNGSHGV